MRNFIYILGITTILAGCSLSPKLKQPEMAVPDGFKEAEKPSEEKNSKIKWKAAETLTKEDRGQWWKIFEDEKLNALETEAIAANPTLKIAAAHVDEARANAGANRPSYLPDLQLGANLVRAQPGNASLAAFGAPAGSAGHLSPYTLYSTGVGASYEVDLFGKVRDNYRAYLFDTEAESADYKSALLALQADVAQNYFSLRAVDSERDLLKRTVAVYEESARIIGHRLDVGDVGAADDSNAKSQLATAKSDLISLDRKRAMLEHALAVLLGKLPSEFAFAEAPIPAETQPPKIPGGLPSSLLERRPDIAAAQSTMAAANLRIGVARTAFFPDLVLTATGGFESLTAGDLFKWSSRTWALGQVAGNALNMTLFDSGRNAARLSFAEASYDESVSNYRQQVLNAFKDVEDNLSEQRLLADQSQQQDAAGFSAGRANDLITERYKAGDVNYTDVVVAQQNALQAQRAAVELKGQRFLTTVTLIRALGGGWDEKQLSSSPEICVPEKEPAV